MLNSAETIKICVLGDDGVGKSSITLQYTQSHFPIDFDPTIEDTYNRDLKINHKDYRLHILDTAAQDDYSHLKDLQLQQADGFILVFGLNSLESMGSAANSYRHIIRVHGELPPSILIGNKADLDNERLISSEEAEQLVEELELNKYFEVSAKINHNIKEAFQYLAETIINEREEKKRMLLLKEKETPKIEVTDGSNDTLATTSASPHSSEESVPTMKQKQTFTLGSSVEEIPSVGDAKESITHVSSVRQRSSQNVQRVNEKPSQKDGGGCCIIM
ncbi:unnamed protein product [Wickerhamomyces anomalus]